jgi:tetratricopeptide (TPR) repeat protein
MWRVLWERYLSLWPLWIWVGLTVAVLTSMVVGWQVGLPRLKQHRVNEFVAQATMARAEGHMPESEANLRSALSLNGNDALVRVVLVQVLIDQGKFAEAMREADNVSEQLGGSPEQFVFDSLLRRKDFFRLMIFAGEQSDRQSERAIWWYKVALSAARVINAKVEGDDRMPVTIQALIQSQNLMINAEIEKAVEALNRLEGAQPSTQEWLLVFAQWLNLNRPIDAALTLAKFGHQLNPFERGLAEFQLSNAGDPWLAVPSLRELLPLANSESRKKRVVVSLIEYGTADQAELLLQAWLAESEGFGLEMVCDLWALGHTFNLNVVDDWDAVFQQRTGKRLPALLGASLGAATIADRRNTLNLMSGAVPISREVLLALYVASSPSANLR